MTAFFCYHPVCKGRAPFASRESLRRHQSRPHVPNGSRFSRPVLSGLRVPKHLPIEFTLSVEAGLPIGLPTGQLRSIAEQVLRRRIGFAWWHDDDVLHDLRVEVAKRDEVAP